MLALQYDLFEDNSDICLLRKENLEVKRQVDNLRKGFFFRHAQLEKIVLKQQQEIEKLQGMVIEVRNR